MKIYFNTSGRSSEETFKNCQKIFDYIHSLGYTNTFYFKDHIETNHLYSTDLKHKRFAHDRAIFHVKSADIVIIEISKNSFSMGYIIRLAIELKKPVIALYHKTAKLALEDGIDYDNFFLREYDDYNIKDVLENSINEASSEAPIRFNILLTPKVYKFLKDQAKNEGMTKASLIRKLLLDYKKGLN